MFSLHSTDVGLFKNTIYTAIVALPNGSTVLYNKPPHPTRVVVNSNKLKLGSHYIAVGEFTLIAQSEFEVYAAHMKELALRKTLEQTRQVVERSMGHPRKDRKGKQKGPKDPLSKFRKKPTLGVL